MYLQMPSNGWATFVKKIVTKNFKKLPNLVTLCPKSCLHNRQLRNRLVSF